MERPPQSEKREEEISPEKRSQMWEILRRGALAGLLIFGGHQAGKQVAEYMHPGLTEQEQEDVIKQVGEENRQENERLSKEWLDKQALTIKSVEGEASRIEDGKLISEATITTEDGKVYETRAETDFTGERQSVTESAGGVDWNRAFVSSIHEDGSGLKVVYETTTDGLKMTIQELGPGGNVLSQRTSLTQETSRN